MPSRPPLVRTLLTLLFILALFAGALPVQTTRAGSNPKILVNEFKRDTNFSSTGTEWIEVVLTQDLTATELQAFYLGDSTSTTASKYSAYNLSGLSAITTTFKAGTIIVLAGGNPGFSQDTAYDPASNDWNLVLFTNSSTYITRVSGSDGDFAGTDVAWVDTASTGSTISADGFAVRWGGTVGALGTASDVALSSAPANPGYAYLTSNLAGATTAGNWTVSATGSTVGQPNGGDNTTWIDGLRTPTDDAPQVSTTSPADGATGVVISADVTVNFDESVSVDSGWLSVDCGSGAVAGATTPASGAAASFTFNPDSNLPTETPCTATVDATKVHDEDAIDPPDNLAANYEWTFTTGLADAAPSVSTVTPADSATGVNVTTTVVVDFSEAVSVDSGWLGLDCGSGAVAGTTTPGSGTATSFTFTPDSNLPYETACSATVTATKVHDGDSDDPPDTLATDYTWGFTTEPADYAPQVSSTVPVTGSTSADATADLVVNFDESVSVDSGWLSVDCGSGAVAGATTPASGAAASFTFNPDIDLPFGTACTATVGAAKVHDEDAIDPPDNLAADYVWPFTTSQCGNTATHIHEIQGSAVFTSPMIGSTGIIIEGIVVGDFQTGLKGFYLQEEDSDADADPLSSEGIFVYDNNTGLNVNLGDKVRVTGNVTEYYSLTELTSVSNKTLCGTGMSASATAATVNLPLTSGDDYEAFEGMFVTIPQTLTVVDNYTLARYGEVGLAQGGMVYQYTHANAPDVTGYTDYQDEIAKRKIILDDGSTTQNPATIIHPSPGLSATNTLRLGDTLPSGLSGALTYRNSLYRIDPVATVNFTSSNPRPASRPDVGGRLTVVSMNLLNFFNGPTFPDAGSRGASTAAEFSRQLAKTVEAVYNTNADVIGLMELENDGYDDSSAIHQLVDELNNKAGSATFGYIQPYAEVTATLGGDQITIGIIYRLATVSPAGDPAVLDTGAFIQTADRRQRPALAQTFEEIASGEKFTFVVNHFKSKGSTCTANGSFPADPDLGDGQGNCNQTRVMAAQDLSDWLATDPTSSGDQDFLVMGDLNSYPMEDPITAFSNAGFTDLIKQYHGTNSYSYLFDGQVSYLDHALASPSLVGQVSGADDWHINAAEPIALDYNVEYKTVAQQASLYSPDQFRAADHDPVVVGLNLSTPANPYDFSDLGAPYGLAWHTTSSVFLGTKGGSGHDPVGGGSNDGVSHTPGVAWHVGADGGSVQITVTSPAGAYVSGWMDWNRDDDFTDADELLFTNEFFSAPSQVRNITFDIPAGVTLSGDFNARFRVYESSQTLLRSGRRGPDAAASPTGEAAGGEVEDRTFTSSPTAVNLAGLSASAGRLPAWLPQAVLALLAALLGGLVLSKRR